MRGSLLSLALAGIVVASPAAQVRAPGLLSTAAQAVAWTQIEQNVAAYVHLRDEVLCLYGPLRPGTMADVLAQIDARRRAVRAARPRAKAGDVIPVNTYAVIREVLATTLRDHEIDVRTLLAERKADVPPHAPKAAINGPFPWQLGAATPYCVLEALPKLPSGIQYRFVGRDLYLIDNDLELVLDIMPNAIGYDGYDRYDGWGGSHD
jgi:hypothetical protein